MKKLFVLMFAVAMTALLFTGCKDKDNNVDTESSSQSTETNELRQRGADAGTIENNVYTSKLLGLKYTADENMVLADVESLEKMNQEYKDKLNGTTLDMFCSMTGDNKSNIRIELMKQESPNATYEQIMSTVTKDDNSTEKKYSVESCKLCDMDFTKVSYIDYPNSKRLVRKFDEYIVIINVVATDNESIDKLLSGFSKVDEG